MNRKHSIAVRCLALVLALVMILSNANLGLTMRAQAAEETGTLFELIAASDCGTKDLNAILAYAEALPKLNDETVKYETEPEMADALLRQDTLAVNAINGWVPYTYTVGGETKEFGGNYTVSLPKDTTEATVVYKFDLNKDAEVKTALDYVAWLASEAGQQDEALKGVSGNTAMFALEMLDYDFTWELIDAIDALTLEDVGIELEYDISDLLTGNPEVDAKIEAEAKKEAEKVANAELDKVKAQYISTVEELQDRIVEEGNFYYSIAGKRGPKYKDMLIIYAMLSEYKEKGLPHFYEHAADIIAEMAALGQTLYNLLGEYDAVTGTYANDGMVNALLEEMGYGGMVGAAELAAMADRMTNGSKTLGALKSYTEIDGTYSDLKALCDAMAKCGTVTGYSTDLCLYSGAKVVLDDTYKYIKVALVGTDVVINEKVETDTVLTEEDVAALADEIANKAKHYTVDLEAVKALVGTKMTEDVSVECPAVVNVYKLNFVDAEGNVLYTEDIMGDAVKYNLVVRDGHMTEYKIGDAEPFTLAFNGTNECEIDINMDDVASGAFKIVILNDDNIYEDVLLDVIVAMNDAYGREAVTLTEENGTYVAMTANISLEEMITFIQTLVEKQYAPIYLNDQIFVNESSKMNVNTLIQAMLATENFSSEKMTAMGQGKEDNLLTATMKVPGYELELELNLTTMPAEMAKVGAALDAVKEFYWFESNNGKLDMHINLPDKVYEAYATTFMAAGYMDDDNLNLSNEIAMAFISDYINYVMDMSIDENTFNNTLKAMHIDKDVSAYYDYFALTRSIFKSEAFSYTYSEQLLTFNLEGDKYDVQDLMAMVGLSSSSLDMAMVIMTDDDIVLNTNVILENPAPAYQALVIEPGKVNDAGYANKLNVIDYTTDLVAKAPTIGKIASVTLLSDINGNLTFNGNVILDLNGKTINGSVVVNGKAVVIDSNLATYNGGTITGSFSANGGMILGGTFGNDISKFLRDGYIQDNGAVRNAMYYIEGNGSNYTYVLNADFYQLCDGYLPSVEALAVDIATDMALNTFPTVGMAYDGKSIYGLNLDNLLNNYLGNSFGGAFDAMMTDLTTYVNVEGVNALANDIVDDLTNIQAMADALNNDKVIGRQYKFSSYPIGAKFVHNEESNTLDIGFVANTKYPKNFSIGMKIEGENKYYDYAKTLLTEMAKVLFIDAEVKLQQPTWYANTNKLTVGGGAYVDFVLDLSINGTSTQAIAIILAYGNPDRADELMAAKGCVYELNKVIADMTVEEVFTALKAMNRNTSISEMADAVGYKYSTAEMARLESAYHVLLCGMGKVLEVIDVTGNDTKLSFLADGKADVTIDAYNKVIDASVKGFTGVAELEFARFSFTLKMATKCTGLMGDVNRDGVVDTDDAALICYYDAELIGESDLHLCVGDVTGDGVVDTDDAALICYYDAELITMDDFPCNSK